VTLLIVGVGVVTFLLLIAFRKGSAPGRILDSESIERSALASGTVKGGGQGESRGRHANATDTNSAKLAAAKGADSHAQASPGELDDKGNGANAAMTHEDYIEQRVAELMDLAMNDDAESLHTILTELNNPDAEIRSAAIEAAKQFGSLDAIPRLTEAISQTSDTADKAALQQAIEFLKLPSLTEVGATAARKTP
jgi:hypothetical protein